MMLSENTLSATDLRLFVRDLRNQAKGLGDVLAVVVDEPDDDQRAELLDWADVYLANAERALNDLRDVVADLHDE